MGIPERKRAELSRKVRGVCDEFTAWRRLSEPGTNLEKHHTQIRRTTTQLGAMAEEIVNKLEAVTAIEDARDMELMVLELHRLWDFFRSKLVQRFVDQYRPHLQVADEFSWATYKPAQAAGMAFLDDAASIKEPPLVFLNGSVVPFTLPRGVQFQAEQVPIGGALKPEHFEEVSNRLPVSVIGVPWTEVDHLPDMTVVGHEVGHTVVNDLHLRADLEHLVSVAVDDERRTKAWVSWAVELFCDWYGTLALGPAFLGGLMDFLATFQPRPGEKIISGPNWGRYPTDALRMAAGIAMLRCTGFEAEADAMLLEWQAVCPKHAMVDFEHDIEPVVAALHDGTLAGLGGKPVSDVIFFTLEDQAGAVKAAGDLLANRRITATNVRQLVAASRLAFACDPACYAERNGSERFRTTIERKIAAGVRAGKGKQKALEEPDRAAGRTLVQEILALGGRPNA